jgi:succinyl-CoA synthetase beta subunit
MNFEEHASKPLLAASGMDVPRGRLARSADEAAAIAQALAPVVVKAQVPTGKRGKAGGILPADDAEQARQAASRILGLEIGGHRVERVLVEEQADIVREFYAAVLNSAASKGPLVMFSATGGMDIEEIAKTDPQAVREAQVDIRAGFDESAADNLVAGLDLGEVQAAVAQFLVKLYACYRKYDAELLEVNPLALLSDGRLVALDCKFVLDDSGIKRQPELEGLGAREVLTELEERGRESGLRYIALDGSVGVLANGAGLTMTTMDVIAHHGGAPANFLEIGGEAYTKAKPALELVLANPNVKSLVVNFCGAFARTDVMTEGVIDAWQALAPKVPVFFSIHGTGAEEAIAMLGSRLGMTPYETMDEAIIAAIAAATSVERGKS